MTEIPSSLTEHNAITAYQAAVEAWHVAQAAVNKLDPCTADYFAARVVKRAAEAELDETLAAWLVARDGALPVQR